MYILGVELGSSIILCNGIGISGVRLEESDIRHTIIKFGLHSLKLNALLHTFCAYSTNAHVCVNALQKLNCCLTKNFVM